MDFELGSDHIHWATGPAPPDPGSEFDVNTTPGLIVPPWKIPMAPNSNNAESSNRKNTLRNVALTLVSSMIYGSWQEFG